MLKATPMASPWYGHGLNGMRISFLSGGGLDVRSYDRVPLVCDRISQSEQATQDLCRRGPHGLRPLDRSYGEVEDESGCRMSA